MTSNEVIKSTRHNLAYKYQFDCGILKMVGPKKARFLAKNQHTQMIFFKSVDELQFIKKCQNCTFKSKPISMSKIN